MSLSPTFDTPYYTGGSVTAEVPGKFDVSIAGRGYMLWTYPDTPYERRPTIIRRPIPTTAPQQDNSGAFGENSLSNEELARRSQDSWDHGAGQSYFDRTDSDNRRFRTSKGVDVWTRWQMKLLPDTASKRASVNTNLALAVAGSRLYLTDGAELRYTPDLTTWTAVTGLPNSPVSLTTDGLNVWTAHGASGVYGTTRSTGASTQINVLQATVIGYVKGRLMAAVTNGLYNITNYASMTAPSVLFTHPNADWRWIGFAEGQSGIYAGGWSGDKSAVYFTTINSDGVGLSAPIHACSLPSGELLTGIGSDVGGIVVLGTTKGVRFAVANADGTLSVGAFIPTPASVLCFEAQDRFIWYGLSNYDTVSTGLGRLDPRSLTDPLVPAYASDLMATGQGAVTSIATFSGKRVFTVSGLGVFQESTNKVASGTLDTGLITYGIPDPKVGMFVDVKVEAPVDTNRVYVASDGGTFNLIGARSTASTDPFQVGQITAETFEIRHELVNADADATAGPVVTRWTMRAYPNPHQGEYIEFTIDLDEQQLSAGGSPVTRNPADEYAFLRALQQTRQIVQVQIGLESVSVQMSEHQYEATTRTSNGKGWNAICSVSLKSTAI